MATVRDFHELNIWKESRILVKTIYEVTKIFPKEEKFGLSNQIQRAVVSIPSNIAEGFDRNSNKDMKQFMMVARGSLAEVYTQLTLATDLGYLTDKKFEEVELEIIKLRKMMNSFIKCLY
jgi:four helix bundle protein